MGPTSEPAVRWGQASGRWVLAATVLGSGMAALDATVVTIALPTIGRSLGAGLAGLQWVVSGYTLTLAALILLGGSLGDRYGRRRVFLIGAVWFALASLGCAAAPSIGALVAARLLQGVGGALLTPGSLAIISASFPAGERGRAIGAWSGLAGIASALGPFVGGWLVEALDWRWIFLINAPVAAVVVAIAVRHVPESSDPATSPHLDVSGAALGTAGLGAITYAVITGGERGATPVVVVAGVVGALALVGFVAVERSSPQPMLPLSIFGSRQFTAVNVVTFAVYAALGGLFFFLVLHLQIVAGFSPLLAGTALLPITVIMLGLSARMGAVAHRTGPRMPMAFGSVVAACGLLLLTRIGPQATYLGDVLPAVAVFGLGLSLVVAPLTTTALATATSRHSGVASGVNNAIARSAGLLAVAILPVAAGLTGESYRDPHKFMAGFTTAMLICAALLVVGAVLSAVLISDRALSEPA